MLTTTQTSTSGHSAKAAAAGTDTFTPRLEAFLHGPDPGSLRAPALCLTTTTVRQGAETPQNIYTFRRALLPSFHLERDKHCGSTCPVFANQHRATFPLQAACRRVHTPGQEKHTKSRQLIARHQEPAVTCQSCPENHGEINRHIETPEHCIYIKKKKGEN